MYRFIKIFERDGLRVHPGVILDKNVVTNGDYVSKIGSSIFKDIPMEYFEKIEPVKYKKLRTQSEKKTFKSEKKSDAASARISSSPESLRLCE
jgi:hypothetical protein